MLWSREGRRGSRIYHIGGMKPFSASVLGGG